MDVQNRVAAVSARIEAVLEGLSPRDRKLLIGLVCFALLVVIGGGAFGMYSTLGSLQNELDDLGEDLAFVQLKQAEYEASASQIEDIERELQKNANQDLSAFLEKAATNASIRERLDSVREISVEQLGTLEQKNYSVSLSKLTQDQAVDFLYEIEASGYPLKITNANFKAATVSGEKVLNVKLEIASFKLLEEG